MPRQPVTRCKNQALLFFRCDTRARAPKVGAGATAYFDEYRRRAITANKINLAALDAKIARQ